MKKLPIYEMFLSFQGEGFHLGKVAFFVRTYGCPLHCSWCDAAGTWHKQFIPKNIQKLSSIEIFQQFEKTKIEFVVLTGGEPCIHNFQDLLCLLKEKKIPLHVETSGAFKIKGDVFPDWLTLSPKKWKMPIPDMIEKADEFKIIVEKEEDVEYYFSIIDKFRKIDSIVWLHPEWSKRENIQILQFINKIVLESGGIFRAGWQIHKLYKIDEMDSRTKNPIPLGGDFKNGF